MVQTIPMPRDDLRGDECWSSRNEKHWIGNEKAYVDVAHDPAAAATTTTNSQSSLPNLTRYQPPSPVQIQSALISCGLEVAEFVLVYSNADGSTSPTVLSSPGLQRYAHHIVNDQVSSAFARSVMRSRTDMGIQNQESENVRRLGHFDADTGHQSPWDQRIFSPPDYRLTETKAEDSDEGRSPPSRKRPRIRRHRQDSAEDHPSVITKTQPLTIGNNAEVDQFYYIRFKDMQQSACKVMGKAFVKLVEPRKQTHHPYTGGNDKAPSWWPPTIGEGAVRHKEPDHLLKPERINLLAHILKMIIEPSEQQNATVQKLGLNVKKLEETTMEVMSNWFNDKEHPENAQKKKYLKEIFRVAKAQERFKRGEIDATTTIPVMCGTENRAQDGSDEEDDVTPFLNETEVEVAEGLQPVVTVSHSPENIVAPPLLHHSDSEMRPLPQNIRQSMQRGSITNGTYDSQLYRLDPTSFQPTQQPIPNLLDTGRRSFAPPGFNSPPTSIPSQWPTHMINNPASSSIFFSQPSSSFTYLPPPQQQQQQSLHSAHHGFEGLHIGSASNNRGNYDSGNSLGSQQSPQQHQQSLRTSNLPSSLSYPSHALTTYGYSGHGNNVYNQPEHDIKHEQHEHQHRPS